MHTINIYYSDGDATTTRINATLEEIYRLYPVGKLVNVGLGPKDDCKAITRVVVIA